MASRSGEPQGCQLKRQASSCFAPHLACRREIQDMRTARPTAAKSSCWLVAIFRCERAANQIGGTACPNIRQPPVSRTTPKPGARVTSRAGASIEVAFNPYDFGTPEARAWILGLSAGKTKPLRLVS